MERELKGKQPSFHREQPGTSFYRIMSLIGLIVAGLWTLSLIKDEKIIPPFQATPTPTRISESYFLEAQAYFDSGVLDNPSIPTAVITEGPAQTADVTDSPDITSTPIAVISSGTDLVINDAIDAYSAALQGDPENALAWAELARIQTYSSSMLRNDTERLARLEEARQSADKAVALAPDDSTVRAIRAFVLDWYASNSLVDPETRADLLIQAGQEASRAFQFDPENALALAYYAEILADDQKWTQAESYAAQAVALDPSLMDTHRVFGYVLETLGKYNSAIQQYQEAARINPNLTFLYIRIGQNYREGILNPDRALEYFDEAARINQALSVQNPQPYIEIARTYTQQGQFFAASINAEKALEMDPTNASTYGQLGIIFRRARNYEGAMLLLKCAVAGCAAEENEMGKVAIQGLPLTNLTVAYYYVEYGTNLAFLSRTTENYCPEARKVLSQVRSSYPDDPILIGIITDSEAICQRLDAGQVPVATITPIPTVEATMEGQP
jgi:tetratricopeptide (TPR) repeat protein